MNQSDEVKMTQSGVFSKDGQKQVFVRFERGKDVAEGSLPSCKMTKNQGFSEEEIASLESYLSTKSDEIFAKAKELNHIRNWF